MKQLNLFDIPIKTSLLGQIEPLLQGFEIIQSHYKPWEQKLFIARAGTVYKVVLCGGRLYVGRLEPYIPAKWIDSINDVFESIREWEEAR